MKEYKGYQIPDTYEEIAEYTKENLIRSGSMPTVPTLIYKVDQNVCITIPYTLEEFFDSKNDEEKKNTYIENYVKYVTLFIDNRTSSN